MSAYWNISWLDDWDFAMQLRPCLFLIIGPLAVCYGTQEQRTLSAALSEQRYQAQRQQDKRQARQDRRTVEMDVRRYRRSK